MARRKHPEQEGLFVLEEPSPPAAQIDSASATVLDEPDHPWESLGNPRPSSFAAARAAKRNLGKAATRENPASPNAEIYPYGFNLDTLGTDRIGLIFEGNFGKGALCLCAYDKLKDDEETGRILDTMKVTIGETTQAECRIFVKSLEDLLSQRHAA